MNIKFDSDSPPLSLTKAHLRLALSLGLIIPRGISDSGHVVQAKLFPARSPRIRHRSELTERKWKNTAQGQDKLETTLSDSEKLLCTFNCIKFLVIKFQFHFLKIKFVTFLCGH